MGTDGERAALVSGHNLYTEEGGKGEEPPTPPPLTHDSTDPQDILSQFHQDALTQVGVGDYQWRLIVKSGFCFMADGVQVFLLPYIVPSIQAEMCLTEDQVPWLYRITLIGLLIGALICSLGDHIGRKSLLNFALWLHVLFNCGAAFAPTFGLFITSRLGSSIGLGMCFPLACVHFAEFLPQNARGKLSMVLVFWSLGGFYVVLLAYTHLPTLGEEIIHEASDGWSWHVVLLLSSCPALFAFFAINCSPESVRYLLYAGRDGNAIMIYQDMYKLNASKSAQYQLTELELPRKVVNSKPPVSKSVWDQMSHNIGQYFASLRHFFCSPQSKYIHLAVTWMGLGFSFYAMGLLIPGRIQALKNDQYAADVKVVRDVNEIRQQYRGRLENQLFENVTFDTCLFADIVLSHVTFKNCTFNYTDFSSIRSSKTFFIDSVLENSRIYDTDLTCDRFIETPQINVTYLSPKPKCRTDIDYRLSQSDLLRENMLRLIAPFIALTVHSLCLYTFPRKKVVATSMLICGVIALGVWFLTDEIPLLVFDFVWSIIYLFAFNAMTIITVEAFPVQLRSTGFGWCFAWFRLFGMLAVSSPEVIPAITASLLFGFLALLFVPDTSFNLM